MVYFGQTGLAFGGYFGILVQSKLFDGRTMLAAPKKKQILKALGRGLLFAFLYVPRQIGLMYFTVPLKNIYLRYFLQSLTPNFFTVFVLFGFADHMCLVVGLYDKVDKNLTIQQESFVNQEEKESEKMSMVTSDD